MVTAVLVICNAIEHGIRGLAFPMTRIVELAEGFKRNTADRSELGALLVALRMAIIWVADFYAAVGFLCAIVSRSKGEPFVVDLAVAQEDLEAAIKARMKDVGQDAVVEEYRVIAGAAANRIIELAVRTAQDVERAISNEGAPLDPQALRSVVDELVINLNDLRSARIVFEEAFYSTFAA